MCLGLGCAQEGEIRVRCPQAAACDQRGSYLEYIIEGRKT